MTVLSRLKPVHINHCAASLKCVGSTPCTSRLMSTEAITPVIKEAVTILPESAVYNLSSHYQHLLDAVQTSSGLPWWAVLVASGIVLRSSTIICNTNYEKYMIKRLPIRLEIGKVTKAIQEAMSKKDHTTAMIEAEKKKYILKANKLSWMNNETWWLLPNALALTLNFLSIRGLAEMSYQPLLDSSLLWLPSLAQADPYYLFPAANAVAVCLSMKYGIDTASRSPITDALQKNTVIIPLMVTIGVIQSFFPSALVLFWLSSSITGIVVVRPLLSNESFRKACGLLSMEEKRKVMEPLQTIFQNANEGYQKAREEGHKQEEERMKKKLEELEARPKVEEKEFEEKSLDELQYEYAMLQREMAAKKAELERLDKDIGSKMAELPGKAEFPDVVFEDDKRKLQ